MNSWFPGGSALTAADFAVLAAILAAVTALGRRAGSRVLTPEDWYLGARRVDWRLAGLGLAAAELSALTVVGVPSNAFRDDWTFLQFFLGAAAARLLVPIVFAPALGGGATVYAYLGARFGPRTRGAAAAIFAAARLLSSAARLLAACVAAGALLGWGLAPTLTLLTLVGIAALARGGALAAVWTGAMQTVVIVGAGLLCALFLLRRADGGLPAAMNLASAAGKLRLFDAGFLSAVLIGFVGSAAAFGADHELAQKLMAARGEEGRRRAALIAVAASGFALLAYLAVGTLLFVFYKQNPGMALPARLEGIFPHFIATAMRPVLRGAALSAIVLASIDAPLSSVAAVFMTDLLKPLSRRELPPEDELKAARAAAVVVALCIAGAAAVLGASDAAMRVALKAGGAAVGPLLGVFLLGLLTTRGRDGAAVGALAGATALSLGLLALEDSGLFPFNWGWIIVVGAAAAFGLGSRLGRGERA